MVRVSAGALKGVRLEVPRQIRPTEERVRQAFFNILGERIEGARMIDGCAGSGAVGIDALSRGASFVAFIESHPACVRALQANLARIDPAAVDGGWTIVRGEIERALARRAPELAPVEPHRQSLRHPQSRFAWGDIPPTHSLEHVLRAHGQKPWADGGIDLLWLDPPYASGLGRKLLQRLGDCAILAPSGIVCVEHARREELPPASGLLRRRSQHRYGYTVLSFYERQTLLPHP